MSFGIEVSGFPTTEMNDGKGVDIIEPTSTGIFVWLKERVRRVLERTTIWDSGRVTERDATTCSCRIQRRRLVK